MCFMVSVYALSHVSCFQYMLYHVFQYMLYHVFHVFGICCITCFMFSVYAVSRVSCFRYMLYHVFHVFGICCITCFFRAGIVGNPLSHTWHLKQYIPFIY